MEAAQSLGVIFGSVYETEFPCSSGTDVAALRGLAAVCDIKDGEQLLQVPLPICLGVAQAHDSLPPWAADLSDEAAISVFLFTLQKSCSAHARYVSSLPQSFGSILFWTDDDLALLQGTSFHEAARGFREETQMEWEYLSEGPGAEWTTSQEFTYERFQWGKSAAASRACTHDEKMTTLLCPGFDLLNHSNEPNAAFEFNGDELVVKATRPVQQSEQILISYGPNSNASLLIFHGFELPAPNRYDCVELFLQLPATPARVAATKALGTASCAGDFQVITAEETANEIVTRHCLFSQEPLPSHLLAVFRLQLGEGPLTTPQEQAARSSLRSTLLRLIADRTHEKVQELQGAQGLSGALVRVRCEEGRILSAALASLDQMEGPSVQ
eukprot:TRINITY_DN70148_c0_g1_i1.p1 TRINITY_DN70148_c0_g1~~TRINITY_DN70148_c0_g1_i1.p1  ORF type:complete len:384 (+),score=53.41 TRINITY_DN70148_c0_g1_i1:54-1205(+)